MQATDAATHVATDDHAGDNRLLRALPRETHARLQPYLEKVRLGGRQILYEPDQPIEHVYFPDRCVVSLFAVMARGAPVEVATVGNEGVVGAAVFLGAATTAWRAVGQIEGDAWRMPAAVFRTVSRREEPLRDLLQRYVQAYADQVSQSAACARAHSLWERCARTLLATHDRMAGGHLQLTQEALASTLGVRRATASGVMGALRAAGIVRYSRGRVTIVDRARLEASSCECYQIMNVGYDRLLGPVRATP